MYQELLYQITTILKMAADITGGCRTSSDSISEQVGGGVPLTFAVPSFNYHDT